MIAMVICEFLGGGDMGFLVEASHPKPWGSWMILDMGVFILYYGFCMV